MKEQQELDAAHARMARFREEMANAVPPPTVPGDPAQPTSVLDLVSEAERLRSRVAEMEAEREEARKKRSRSLSVPSPDLVGGPGVTLQKWGALHDSACRAAQMGYHGNSDQPREYVGPEFQPIQLIGLTDVEFSDRRLSTARRVLLCGGRGVRVGEARNPGPEFEDSIRPIQWESGVQFSLRSRASGLTSSVRESDTEKEEVAQGDDGRNVRRRLRLMWSSDTDPHMRQAEALSAELPNSTRQRVADGSPTAEVAASRAHEPRAQLVEGVCCRLCRTRFFHRGECSATEAFSVGFNVLRATMRSWGISNPQDLSEWLSWQGFPSVRPGNHLSARAQ